LLFGHLSEGTRTSLDEGSAARRYFHQACDWSLGPPPRPDKGIRACSHGLYGGYARTPDISWGSTYSGMTYRVIRKYFFEVPPLTTHSMKYFLCRCRKGLLPPPPTSSLPFSSPPSAIVSPRCIGVAAAAKALWNAQLSGCRSRRETLRALIQGPRMSHPARVGNNCNIPNTRRGSWYERPHPRPRPRPPPPKVDAPITMRCDMDRVPHYP
jgi:hypothetical protein